MNAEGATTPMSRVERRRQATMDEIVAASRTLLHAGEEVTISSVASSLGLTPPALYRYVPNLRGLNDLIVRAILDELVGRATAAADRHEDPAARLVAAATAFRQWALNNHAEFRAVFAPSDPLSAAPAPDDPPTTTEITCAIFASIASEVMAGLPEFDSEAPPAYLATLDKLFERRRRYWRASHDLPPVAWWQFERGWVRFLGVLSSEVYGFIDREIVVSGDMFVSILSDIGRDFRLEHRIPDLIDVAVETATWVNEQEGYVPLDMQEPSADQA